jgi:DNA-binding SARP family transcriptional activator
MSTPESKERSGVSHPTLLLLGSPRITRDGEPVEVDTRKAIALLAYLAVTHERHSRDALAALLWPDYGQTRARAALRRTLSVLNKALAGDWLDVDREHIGLKPNSFSVDVDHFHSRLAECRTHDHLEADVCQACLPLLTEAVTLYRDDFMVGFTLRDSPQFDDWQFLQAESLRRELAGALERLVHAYAAQGEWRPAITYARRWLALDPLHEPAHRALMQVYAWAGQRATALRQYRECVRVLAEELGVSPLKETTQLYEAIKNNQLSPPPIQPPILASTSVGEVRDVSVPVASTLAPLSPSSRPLAPSSKPVPPLVGRAAEWATLLEAYTIAKDGGQVVILEGEAGIGKTRLAEEFLAYARARGAAAIATRCYAGEKNLAYGPFVEGLSTAIGQAQHADQLERVPAHSMSEAARLLPELNRLYPGLPPAPPLDTPGAQSRFFEGISQVLLALCGGSPLGVLFFDDLHWADAASLDLLTYLVRRLHRRPLCILITWRSEQVPAGHRLRELLAEAQRAGTATVLRLPRLNQAAVEEWVESVAGDDAALARRLGQRLYAETEGLPLFLEEYLSAIAQGMLPTVDAGWSLPGGVRDLLQGRLHAISETGRQVLTTAAVIGRSFDFDTVREASGRSEEETVTALEELIAQGLVEELRVGTGGVVRESLPPTYDFNHEKLRALVYDEISLARRRRLHQRIAEVLVSYSRRRCDSTGRFQTRPYSLIAYHYQRAGQTQEAAAYFKLAGEHARTLYANAEALAHFRTALALGHPDTAALHEAIGDLHTLGGEYGAALASYEAAGTLREDPNVRANIEHKLGIVHQRRGEWELAERHVQAALTALGETGSAAQRARLYADWSLLAHQRGQTDQALDLAHRALELSGTAGDTRALAEAHNRLGILATSQGDLAQACYHLQQSLELAETLPDPAARAAALNNLALAYKAGGETEQALKLAEAALALCIAQGDRHHEAALHNNLADLLHAAGQSEAAMAHLKQAVAIYADIGVEAGTVQPAIWKLTEW